MVNGGRRTHSCSLDRETRRGGTDIHIDFVDGPHGKADIQRKV